VLAFGRLRFSLDLLGRQLRKPAQREGLQRHRYSPTRRMRDDQSTKFRRSAQRLFSLALRKEADSSRLPQWWRGERLREAVRFGSYAVPRQGEMRPRCLV
jgi:hypothetical protein